MAVFEFIVGKFIHVSNSRQYMELFKIYMAYLYTERKLLEASMGNCPHFPACGSASARYEWAPKAKARFDALTFYCWNATNE